MKKLFGILLLLLALTVRAKDVKLTWTVSPDTNAVGYNIYCVCDCSTNTTPMNCTNIVDVGNASSVIITGLVPSTTYSFAATAYDDFGDESEFSNWLIYTTPAQLSLGTWPTINLPALSSTNMTSGWHETNFYIVLTNKAQSEFYRFASPKVINSTNQP